MVRAGSHCCRRAAIGSIAEILRSRPDAERGESLLQAGGAGRTTPLHVGETDRAIRRFATERRSVTESAVEIVACAPVALSLTILPAIMPKLPIIAKVP